MEKQIEIDGSVISYDLQQKRIKNIYLRIKPDKSVVVSANKRIPVSYIEAFIRQRKNFIFEAFEKFDNLKAKKAAQYFSEDELKEYIFDFAKKIYPIYRQKGIAFPQINFRNMTSRWGSCNPRKGTLNFNTNLMFSPPECVEYVVYHEFTHFLQPNHSALFYYELSKVCPGWSDLRKKLKETPVWS